ncbi:MAG: glutamine amidotransferase [Planctomycetaceae bacterium]
MILAGLVFGGSQWQWVAATIVAVAALLVWRGAAVYRNGPRGSYLPLVFKLAAMLLLAFCLTEPLWSSMRTRPGENLFVVLADNSASLQIRDADAATPRSEALRTLLTDRGLGWQPLLEQEFDVRRFAASSRLESMTDFQSLEFTEPETSLHHALGQLSQRFLQRPVAGVLLFTDGIFTDQRNSSWNQDSLPPVYPVVIGRPERLIDIALGAPAVSTTAFEDAPVTITAEVHHTGCAGRAVTAQIMDDQQQVVKEETLRLPEEGRGTSLRFQIRPVQPGLSFYTLRVQPDVAADAPPLEEATLANNERKIVVDRGGGPYRILYVSGRPNWEFKFLNRALETDEQVKLTGLIRIAKREPKFDWRGRAGETSNPLFRGFDGVDAETEHFDQPVIVRLNTQDAQELRSGFPKTAEELFPFHAVVIDDLEAEFFTTVQFELLERFVSERGGSLLMLGGMESFAQGGYRRTPLARVLPVSLEESSPSPVRRWRLDLTRDGWLQPWARLRSTEADEQTRLKAWPTFHTLNRVGREKPGASVIAEVQDPQGNKLPAVVAQRFGEGRCAAVLVGDFWRAQLERTDDERKQDDLGKAWRQLVRWLIADVPERTSIKLEPVQDDRAVVRLEIRPKTLDFQPQDNASIEVTATMPDGLPLRLSAEPSLAEAGLYEALLAVKKPGPYRVAVKVTDSEGKVAGEGATGWVHDPLAEEFRRVTPDREWLTELAQQTGGRVVAADDLRSFVSELTRRPDLVTETTTSPLWQHPLMLTLIALGLCGEWGLRRWRGLP